MATFRPPPTTTQHAELHHESLPTPRVLITNLINLLPPRSLSEAATAANPSTNVPTNPLAPLPAQLRDVITALHILLPALLLPALDLLDRGLVRRFIEILPSVENRKEDHSGNAIIPHDAYSYEEDLPPQQPHRVFPPQAHIHLTNSAAPSSRQREMQQPLSEPGDKNKHNRVYTVLSSRVGHHRRSTSTSNPASAAYHQGEKSYLVRLEAWNCSCAAFAFSAFPGPASSVGFGGFDGRVDFAGEVAQVGQEGGVGENEGEWEFGGLSRDGRDGGAVPCCKHLLSCLLAECWDGWVGEGIKEVRVVREAMAGIGCLG